MTCTVARRVRLKATADALAELPRVAGTDLLDQTTEPGDTWTLEITLDADAIPCEVLRALSINRLRVREARPRGAGFYVLVDAHGRSACTVPGP